MLRDKSKLEEEDIEYRFTQNIMKNLISPVFPKNMIHYLDYFVELELIEVCFSCPQISL